MTRQDKIMNHTLVSELELAKAHIDVVLYEWEGDDKAGGSIAQQLGGISLELLYIISKVKR